MVIGLGCSTLFDFKNYTPLTETRAQVTERKVNEDRPRAFSKSAISFEANQGQLKGAAKFVARGGSGDVYLTNTEIVLTLRNRLKSEAESRVLSKDDRSRVLNRNHAIKQADVIRMKLAGSKAAKVSGLDELSGTVNYFIGTDPKNWHTNIRTYRRVKYQSIYSGIDQIFYGNGDHLEHDFVVSPGANPRAIRYRFTGHSDLSIDDAGDLVLHTTSSHMVRLHKPVAYQEIDGARWEVPIQYVMKRNREIGFEIGAYDRNRQIVIDPVLSYSSYLGGSGNEAGFDISVDDSGSAYVTGSSDSSEFSPTSGRNAFVAKFSPDGTQRTYLAIIGGSADDTGFSIVVDGAGAAYVTGVTDSQDFPMAHSFQSSFAGGSQDAFIAKLGSAGSSIVYSTYFGGSGNDTGLAIATDATGSAYVTGSTDSPELSTLGNTDTYVTKLTPSGDTRSYFSILGGSRDDTAFDIAVDGQGNAYVAGSTESTDFTRVNALQPNFGGLQDAFLAKLGSSGVVVYSTYFGGSGSDSGFGIASDSSGNAYISGATDSPEFTALGGRDVFVAKFNATGAERSYLTILGGSADDAGFAVAVDSGGNAYVVGATSSGNFTTLNPLQPALGGSQDVFIAKLNASGSSLDYSTYFGVDANQAGFAVALDRVGNAYVTGFTSSNSFLTRSAYQSNSGGNGDAFVLKTSSTTTPPTVQFSSSSSTVSEGGGRITITVARSGDTTSSASAGFITIDSAGLQNCNVVNGLASSRCDYISSLGMVSFAPGETSKTISVLIVDDVYAEGNETFTIGLNNPSGATLGAQSTATVTITDNDAANGANPIDAAGFFVDEHYGDFLGRLPDPAGRAFWTNQITSCGSDAGCIEVRRIDVSASFFLSIEFQDTGYLVERIYKTAYGDADGSSTFGGAHTLKVPIVRLYEFLADSQEIGKGVVVLEPGWEQALENNKNAFAAAFVQRSRFASAFPTSKTPAEFVDKLFLNAGVTPSAADRNAAIGEFGSLTNTDDVAARGRTLRRVAENGILKRLEFNKAFVLMQYFGYLRRNPNDPQDSDYTGYDFWLTKLNQFNGNYIQAEMVKAFLSSFEYRRRFGPITSTPATNGAVFVNQSAPASVVTGEDFTASVRMRNVGNTTWTPEAAYRLGTQAPQDNDIWGLNRGLLSTRIAPNSETAFSLQLAAPATPGSYSFKWRMVQDAVEWFGEDTPTLTINIIPLPSAAPNMAAFVSQSVPSVMSAGTTYTVSVTMKNTGTTTWTAADAYRLGSRAPQDNDIWGRNRVLLPNNVLPGEELTFTYNVTAPSTPGTYNFRWRMVRDGVEWFGEFTPNRSVTVT